MTISEHHPAGLLGSLNITERKNAPNVLYTMGNEELLRRGLRVSVVGSRNATPHGLARARRLSQVLVDHNITVVSGLATGIDTAAHTQAIDADGTTIAVLGTPLDQCSPASNRELMDKIARHHLVVSQFPVGTRPGRKGFPMRNRTMALLSHATVIVEAGEKSGTLHQGWEALRLGRPLFIMASLLDKQLDWPAEMIRYGADILSNETVDHFLESLPEPVTDGLTELPF